MVYKGGSSRELSITVNSQKMNCRDDFWTCSGKEFPALLKYRFSERHTANFGKYIIDHLDGTRPGKIPPNRGQMSAPFLDSTGGSHLQRRLSGAVLPPVPDSWHRSSFKY
eukprot:765014-Hanusia_phi.AAC.5